jgi:hypothetical protein
MSSSSSETVLTGTQRAERFPISIPVHYREPHQPEWVQGKIENISRSGILLLTKASLEPRIKVELRLELPVSVWGEGRGEILCKGTIVRTEEHPSSDLPISLAVAIRSYRMARSGQLHSNL